MISQPTNDEPNAIINLCSANRSGGTSTNFQIKIDEVGHKYSKLALKDAQIPVSSQQFNYSNSKITVIENDSKNSPDYGWAKQATIPDGTYNATELASAAQTALNALSHTSSGLFIGPSNSELWVVEGKGPDYYMKRKTLPSGLYTEASLAVAIQSKLNEDDYKTGAVYTVAVGGGGHKLVITQTTALVFYYLTIASSSSVNTLAGLTDAYALPAAFVPALPNAAFVLANPAETNNLWQPNDPYTAPTVITAPTFDAFTYTVSANLNTGKFTIKTGAATHKFYLCNLNAGYSGWKTFGYSTSDYTSPLGVLNALTCHAQPTNYSLGNWFLLTAPEKAYLTAAPSVTGLTGNIHYNLSGSLYYMIYSSIGDNCGYDSSSGSVMSFLAKVPVNVGYEEITFDEVKNLYWNNATVSPTNCVLTITLFDDQHNIVDLQGLDWSLTLLLKN